MTAEKMNVWTKAEGEQAWICVAEDVTVSDANEIVHRNEEAAAKHLPGLRVQALPVGQEPVPR